MQEFLDPIGKEGLSKVPQLQKWVDDCCQTFGNLTEALAVAEKKDGRSQLPTPDDMAAIKRFIDLFGEPIEQLALKIFQLFLQIGTFASLVGLVNVMVPERDGVLAADENAQGAVSFLGIVEDWCDRYSNANGGFVESLKSYQGPAPSPGEIAMMRRWDELVELPLEQVAVKVYELQRLLLATREALKGW